MTLLSLIRKLGILIIALIALLLTRMGISYLLVLVVIGIITPILCGNKKDAVFAGILYVTLSYIISYPSGLFLINFMPSTEIPITVSSSTVMFNLFIGWLVPAIIATIICGITSFIGYIPINFLSKDSGNNEEYYFKTENEINQIDEKKLNKKEKKELLFLSPIQKAKNRKLLDNEEEK